MTKAGDSVKKKISVDLIGRGYDITVQKGLLKSLGKHISKIYKGKRVFVLTDENVGRYYLDAAVSSLKAEGFASDCMILPPEKRQNPLKRCLPFMTGF